MKWSEVYWIGGWGGKGGNSEERGREKEVKSIVPSYILYCTINN